MPKLEKDERHAKSSHLTPGKCMNQAEEHFEKALRSYDVLLKRELDFNTDPVYRFEFRTTCSLSQVCVCFHLLLSQMTLTAASLQAIWRERTLRRLHIFLLQSNSEGDCPVAEIRSSTVGLKKLCYCWIRAFPDRIANWIQLSVLD